MKCAPFALWGREAHDAVSLSLSLSPLALHTTFFIVYMYRILWFHELPSQNFPPREYYPQELSSQRIFFQTRSLLTNLFILRTCYLAPERFKTRKIFKVDYISESYMTDENEIDYLDGPPDLLPSMDIFSAGIEPWY